MLRRLMLVCLFFLGCQVPEGRVPKVETSSQDDPAVPEPGANRVGLTSPKKIAVPAAQSGSQDLAQAAIFLEKGDDLGACFHLGRYLQHHPHHAGARLCFAEILSKLGKWSESRVQFDLVDADSQAAKNPDLNHQIHVHTRLLEIAEAEDDDYGVHLHRGIGLWLLAQSRSKLAEPDGEVSVEGLLCKSAGELTMAQGLKPGEARPSWYLFVVWRKLAQPKQARKWLAQAQEAAPFSTLTAVEQRDLAFVLEANSARNRR